MKRFIAVVLTACVFVGFPLAADEAVLLDFSSLTADYPSDKPKENSATMVDFSGVSGSSYTDEEKAMMKTSLAIPNWDIIFSSSSRTVFNQSLSTAKQAKVRDGAPNFAGATVMGVRVHFPTGMYNGWALVAPPFEIPAYLDKGTIGSDGKINVAAEEAGRGRMFDGVGVVKNVGVLKSLSMNVHGLNFPHTVSVILKDENNEEQEIHLGTMKFDGWRKMAWENPNYISEARNRELRVFPLYPRSAPMRKLVGIRIYRDGSHEGGDFIGYFKDISIIYDKALLTLERDIDDEGIWGILQKREEARRNAEIRRLGHLQVLRYLENKKMHVDD